MKDLNLRSIFLTFFTLYVIIALSTEGVGAKGVCRACKKVVEDFVKGLEKTKKLNFGGGNSRWEEKTLGKWANSETRLIEIWDTYLCKEPPKEQCHMLLEKHEEDLEYFFYKVHPENDTIDMLDWFCMNRIAACCPNGTHGPDCKECPGGKERPCMGKGTCEGAGNRVGAGVCRCDEGHEGNMCEQCNEKFFEEKNETDITCTRCHLSCLLTCKGEGPKGCDECYDGWLMTEEEGCVDVDECKDTPCEENQYCSNTPGSYNCFTCHRACQGCSEYGADKCEACNEGYTKEEETCVDIDECAADTSLCSGDKQWCENTDGGHVCKCEEGYMYMEEGRMCIPKPIDDDEVTEQTEDDDGKVEPEDDAELIVDEKKETTETEKEEPKKDEL